jgi:multidrug resistance protein
MIPIMSAFAVTFTSSAYSESHNEVIREFGISDEVFAAGISLYVLGFAVGPALWGPLSEMYGRRILFVTTQAVLVGLTAGAAASPTMTALLIFRFFGGAFSAAPLTNGGAVVADLFAPEKRGMGMAIFAAAPFLGPVLAPTVGGFVSENVGWRWVQGVCCIFIGVVWLICTISVPETYAPILLHQRAKKLSRAHPGRVYISVLDKDKEQRSVRTMLVKALVRPWKLLFREPIVLVASTYLSIIYATIYMFLGAFSIVYNEKRGWSEGEGGLAFLGIVVGMVVGVVWTVFDNRRYAALSRDGRATPESRLFLAIPGSIALPAGMFAFAWTNGPNVHWSASVILSSLFGLGSVLVWTPVFNYLIDSYVIYAASVLAATAMQRSLIGAAFPLFTNQ